MPWTDSYFLSRFRSHDSEGGKKGKNEEEVENCEKLVEKKEGAMLGKESREKNGKTSRGRCRAMCVEEPKLPFLFFFFFFFSPLPLYFLFAYTSRYSLTEVFFLYCCGCRLSSNV